MIAEQLLDLGRSTGVRYTALRYAGAIVAASFPNKTFRLAGRSLMILMMLNRLRKKILQ